MGKGKATCVTKYRKENPPDDIVVLSTNGLHGPYRRHIGGLSLTLEVLMPEQIANRGDDLLVSDPEVSSPYLTDTNMHMEVT